ncbi:MAG: glycosyltransferase [Alphaproteobacteria bacterium]|nr:glycosyltransferase [Alphaproteobacteria bacterium]MCB9697338.1 glycosyltransferase [Alphaproteobacteria bacterium]
MKLLFVVTHLAYGGAETQVVELCAHFVRRGWEVSLVSLMTPSGLTERLDALGVPWSTLGLRRGELAPRLVTGLARIIRRQRPDVVHSHTLPANFAARAARLLSRPPVLVTSAHNLVEGGRAKMLYYRLTDRLADLTTNCSESAVERYIRIKAAPADRIRYMPNGIDTERFHPDDAFRAEARSAYVADDGFLWLAVARLTEQKDWPNMFAACERALRAQDRLLVVGNGELEDDVRRWVAERGLQDRVLLLGTRTDIPELMRAADGYVMSSAWEGLPIVLLEASASGLPIVATDVGGNHQLVLHDRTGWLVPASDAEALGTAMTRLATAPRERRDAMGAAARAHVEEHYSIAAVADQWEEIYHQLLDKKAGRAA